MLIQAVAYFGHESVCTKYGLTRCPWLAETVNNCRACVVLLFWLRIPFAFSPVRLLKVKNG